MDLSFRFGRAFMFPRKSHFLEDQPVNSVLVSGDSLWTEDDWVRMREIGYRPNLIGCGDGLVGCGDGI